MKPTTGEGESTLKNEVPAKRPVGRPRKYPVGQVKEKPPSKAAAPLTKIDERILLFIDKLKADGRIRYFIDVADALGHSKQELNARKSGRYSFTIEDIQKLCDEFGMNPNWLFGYENQMFRRFQK